MADWYGSIETFAGLLTAITSLALHTLSRPDAFQAVHVDPIGALAYFMETGAETSVLGLLTLVSSLAAKFAFGTFGGGTS